MSQNPPARSLINQLYGQRINPLISLVIFLSFLPFYLFTSFSLSNTDVFSTEEILFGMDMQRIVNDLTQFHSIHYRTTVHPLFVLFFNPAGEILQKLTHSDITSAIILNSMFGAAGVAIAYAVLSLILESKKRAFFFAVIFGVTSGQFFHAVIIETYAFSSFSLVCTYLLFIWSIREKKIILPLWIICGIFTLAITTTNVFQTLICFVIACVFVYGLKPIGTVINKTIFFLVCIFGIAVILSMIQRIIYPLTNPFFLPGAYKEEFDYASLLVLRDPILVLSHLARIVFLVSYIAPIPGKSMIPGLNTPIISLETSTSFTPAGVAAVILWSGCWAWAIFITVRKIVKSKPIKWDETAFQAGGFILCLLFNIGLHSFYGAPQADFIQYFLFSGNFVFLLPGILSLLFKEGGKWVDISLATLAMCILINNVLVIQIVNNILSS